MQRLIEYLESAVIRGEKVREALEAAAERHHHPGASDGGDGGGGAGERTGRR